MSETIYEIPIDTSEAVSFDNSPVPDNDYTLSLVKAKIGVSKAGNPKVDWEFKVVEDDDYNGRRIFHSTNTTGKAAGMFRAVIQGFGYDFDEWVATVGGKVTMEALASLYGERTIGKVRTEAVTEERKAAYPNAEPRNKITSFRSA